MLYATKLLPSRLILSHTGRVLLGIGYIEKLEIKYKLFDIGYLPYPLEDKSFDISSCFSAIEAYCHPEHWDKIIAELCRITRSKIILHINPPPKQHQADIDSVKGSSMSK